MALLVLRSPNEEVLLPFGYNLDTFINLTPRDSLSLKPADSYSC